MSAISGTLLYAQTGEADPADAGPKGVEDNGSEFPGVTPGYDIAQTARDPFFEPGAGQETGSHTDGDNLTDSGILQAAVDQFQIQGVIGESPATGSIIISGKLHRVEDRIEVNIGGAVYEIKIKNIMFNPLGVVFAYNDEQLSVRVGNQQKKE